MMELDAIIKRLRDEEKSEEARRQSRRYVERAFRDIREKGYYVIEPLEDQKLGYPFSIALHPSPPANEIDFIPHCHSHFELVYVARGSCHNKIKDYEIVLSQGDLLLMNPNALHALYTTENDAVVFNFMISGEVFHQTFFSLMSDNIISSFILNYLYHLDKESDYLILNAVPGDPLINVLDRLIIEYYKHLPGYESILVYGLGEVFCYMARNCMEQFSSEIPLPQTSALSSLLLYILKNYAAVTIKDVAFTFGYNEKYVSRLIKKELNTTFSSLVRSVRLQHAASMLKKTTMPVNQIACDVGYQNLSHFYDIFYEQYHMTPMEFRQGL